MSTARVLARLLSFMRPFAGRTVLSVLLGAGTVACAIGLLGTSADLIARAALRPSIAELQVAIVGVRFFGIARGLLRYLDRLVAHDVNFRLLAGLRVWFYQAVEPLAPAGLHDWLAGDLLARAVSDIETLENFYVRAVAPPVTAFVITVGIGFFVGRWDAQLGLALAGGLILSAAGVPLLTRTLARAPGKAVVFARAAQSAAALEGIQGLADLLAYSQGQRWLDQVGQAGRAGARAQMRLTWVAGLSSGLNSLITQLTLIIVLATGIGLVSAGQIDGALLAVISLVTLASFEAATPLAQAGQQMETSLQAARRLFELAEKKPHLQLAGRLLRPDTSALAVRGLTFRYEPHLPPVLVDFDLELPPGKRVALVGDSGAGKTTLLRLLARFWDAPAGSIWLAGEDILAYDPDDIRQLLGMAEQKPYLFTATLRQNLRLARPDAEEDDLHHVLAAAGLAGWLASLPNGLDTWLGENGAAMSGGERQRLAVARALLRDAPVLLLDEPAAHLDGLNETRLMRQLNEVTRGRSLILVTHRLRQLEWLDEILVLRAGRVVERGTHAELLVAGGVYAEMRRLQSATLAEVGELS